MAQPIPPGDFAPFTRPKYLFAKLSDLCFRHRHKSIVGLFGKLARDLDFDDFSVGMFSDIE